MTGSIILVYGYFSCRVVGGQVDQVARCSGTGLKRSTISGPIVLLPTTRKIVSKYLLLGNCNTYILLG